MANPATPPPFRATLTVKLKEADGKDAIRIFGKIAVQVNNNPNSEDNIFSKIGDNAVLVRLNGDIPLAKTYVDALPKNAIFTVIANLWTRTENPSPKDDQFVEGNAEFSVGNFNPPGVDIPLTGHSKINVVVTWAN